MFQNYVKSMVPVLANNPEFLRKVTESYAQDMGLWMKNEELRKVAEKMGEAAAKFQEQAIIKILVAAQE